MYLCIYSVPRNFGLSSFVHFTGRHVTLYKPIVFLFLVRDDQTHRGRQRKIRGGSRQSETQRLKERIETRHRQMY